MRTKILAMVVVMAVMVALPLAVAFDGKTAVQNSLSATEISNEEKVEELVPSSYKTTDRLIRPRNRYLMYTYDGRNIMWGTYGAGYFVGKDNLGKSAWGIYGRSFFAGFYDGKFFHGYYGRGTWRAYWLFNKYYSSGRYVTFPSYIIHGHTEIETVSVSR